MPGAPPLTLVAPPLTLPAFALAPACPPGEEALPAKALAPAKPVEVPAWGAPAAREPPLAPSCADPEKPPPPSLPFEPDVDERDMPEHPATRSSATREVCRARAIPIRPAHKDTPARVARCLTLGRLAWRVR